MREFIACPLGNLYDLKAATVTSGFGLPVGLITEITGCALFSDGEYLEMSYRPAILVSHTPRDFIVIIREQAAAPEE